MDGVIIRGENLILEEISCIIYIERKGREVIIDEFFGVKFCDTKMCSDWPQMLH